MASEMVQVEAAWRAVEWVDRKDANEAVEMVVMSVLAQDCS